MEFRPFKAGHLLYLKPQEVQKDVHASVVHSGMATVYETGTALSGWQGSKCIGAAGLLPVWPHKALAWAFLSDAAASDMLAIVRKVRRVIALSPYKRVELTVAEGHEQGHRFARLIGATCETPEPMRFYGSNGDSEYMYAVLKGD